MAHNEVAELGDSLAGLPSLQELRVGHNELTRCEAGSLLCLLAGITQTTIDSTQRDGSVRGTLDSCAYATPGAEMPACRPFGRGQN